MEIFREKKLQKKNLQIYFYRGKNIVLIWNKVYSDTSELGFSDEETVENYRNFYVAEKCTFSILSKMSIPNFDSIN